MHTTCQQCGHYVTAAGRCRTCTGQPAMAAAGPGSRGRRAPQTTRSTGPSRGHGLWVTVTGQVVREQEIVSGPALGSTALGLGSMVTVVGVAVAIGGEAATRGVVGGLLLVMAPVILLALMMSLGRGGLLAFGSRAVGHGARLGNQMAQRHRSTATIGRSVLVRTPAGDRRGVVAKAVDLPIGSTATLTGLQWQGHVHAWTVQVDGMDERPLRTTGVLRAQLLVVAAIALIAVTLVSAVLGASS